MWGHSRTVWALFVCALFMIGSFTVVVGAPPEEEPNAPEEPIAYGECYGGSSERTTIIETFTATWCQYCPPQAFANIRLYDELGHYRFLVLVHHAKENFSIPNNHLYLPYIH